MNANKALHHPPHLFIDQSWYFITSTVYQKLPILRPRPNKQIVLENLLALSTLFSLQVYAWVILDNHYHLLIYSPDGGNLRRFIQRLHGRSSFEINKREDQQGRQIWHNYWDTLVEDEAGLWMRFNYIHHNPVKHNYVSEPNEWEFSSYRKLLNEKGIEWMDGVQRTYPIADFSPAEVDPLDQTGIAVSAGSSPPAKA